MKRLLLYGLQRSGTNLAQELIRRRYRVTFLNEDGDRSSALHKHVRLYADKSLVPVSDYFDSPSLRDFADFQAATAAASDACVVVSKHPLAWLASYRRWAVRNRWPLPSHHYAAEYAAFYGHWLHYAEQTDRVHFLRYEDLLDAAPAALANLALSVPLTRRSLAAVRGLRPVRVPMSGRFTRKRRDAYRRGDYLSELSADDPEAVRRLIPQAVWSGLGYDDTASASRVAAP